ncbi:9282_t:CDS:2 [Entrophospora sp. SA101]|nr:9282_t:CDS:2 [Entrophospora sp. SA101]
MGNEVTKTRKPQPGQFYDSVEEVAEVDKEAGIFYTPGNTKGFSKHVA